MKRKITILLSSVLLSILQGCGSMMNPIGDAKFDCNRKQDAKSPYCRSFKSVERSTNGEIPPSRFDQTFKMSDLDRMTGIAPDDVEENKQSKSIDKPTLLPHQKPSYGQPLAGAPVREGPVIQRVWIKRFVDGSDLLTENTVVYKEIRSTRWHGFDEREGGTSRNTYPHRPTESATVEGKPSNENGQSQTEFSQPGQPSEFAESVNDPAVSGTSSSTSMPQ